MKWILLVLIALNVTASAQRPKEDTSALLYKAFLDRFMSNYVPAFKQQVSSDVSLREEIFKPCSTSGQTDWQAAWNNFYRQFLAFASQKLQDEKENLKGTNKEVPVVFKDIAIRAKYDKSMPDYISSICNSVHQQYVDDSLKRNTTSKLPPDTARKYPTKTPHKPSDTASGKPSDIASGKPSDTTSGKHPDITQKRRYKVDTSGKGPKDHTTKEVDSVIQNPGPEPGPGPTGDTGFPIVRYLLLALSVVAVAFAIVQIAKKRVRVNRQITRVHVPVYPNPDSLPPAGNIDMLDNLKTGFLVSSESLSAGLKKSLYWSLRMMSITDGGMIMRSKIPGFKYMAYGFFRNAMNEYNYGIIVYHDQAISKTERKQFGSFQPFMYIDDQVFAIVYRPIVEIQNSFTCNPINGTGACYCSGRDEKTPTGILTAKHVTGPQSGAKIQLSCGHTGVVSKPGPDGIDAAVIESTCVKKHAQSAKQVSPLQYVPQYMEAEFWGISSDLVHTRVEHVTDTRNIFTSADIPARIFLVNSGKAGDSGALIMGNNQPIGIYMGQYMSEGIGQGGLAQHLFQAAELLNIKLYK